jgi:hypothetical protein
MEQTHTPATGENGIGVALGAPVRTDARPGGLSGLASRAVSAGVVLAMAAGPALAQAQDLLPPENKEGIKGRAFISGFAALLLVALVLAGAFLKSKRGHQD